MSKLPPYVHFDRLKKGGRPYYYVVRVGSRTKCCRGFNTAEDAYMSAIQFKAHPSFKSRKLTLKEASELWIVYMRGINSKETVDNYVGMLRNYVYPYLDPHHDIRKFNDGHFTYWRSQIDKVDTIKTPNKNRLITLFKLLYDYLRVYLDIDNKSFLRINPFVDRDLTPFFETSETVKYITPQELRLLVFATDDDYFKLVYLIAYSCGLRVGEIRGLTVDCYRAGLLCIAKQGAKNGRKDRIKQLKTASSRRLCRLPRDVASLLEYHIKLHGLSGDDFVFYGCESKRMPVSANTIQRQLAKSVKAAGLDFGIHFHLFRHSAASFLDHHGFRTSMIKSYLGHTSEETTKKYYIHSTSEDLDTISEALNTAFFEDK